MIEIYVFEMIHLQYARTIISGMCEDYIFVEKIKSNEDF